MENDEADLVRDAFAKVLRQKRKEQNWSQEELGFRAGITMRYVSLLECNKRQPTISTIYTISQALNVSMTDFMELIEHEMSEE